MTAILVLEPMDPRRPALGRAVRDVFVLSALFFAASFASKEIPGVYAVSPWRDDPYDAFVSFALIFMPALLAVGIPSLFLCRRAEALPASRIRTLLRACRLLIAVTGVTLTVQWVSIVQESAPATRIDTVTSVALLAAFSAGAGFAGWRLGRAEHRLDPLARQGSDWVGDALTTLERAVLTRGRLAAALQMAIRYAGPPVLRLLRQYPVLSAAAVSTAGAAVIVCGAAREEGASSILAIIFAVATCGLFAFVVAAGAYLGLVRREGALSVVRRRGVDSVVAGSMAAPIGLAFRDAIWRAVGVDAAAAGAGDLALLLGGCALAATVSVFLIESALRMHFAMHKAGTSIR